MHLLEKFDTIEAMLYKTCALKICLDGVLKRHKMRCKRRNSFLPEMQWLDCNINISSDAEIGQEDVKIAVHILGCT